MPRRECPTCGSSRYHRIRYAYPHDSPEAVVHCTDCSHIPMKPCYDDVYLGPGGGLKTDPNLVDPKTDRPIPFQTKQDKAAIMKMLNVAQSPKAEKHHGYRNEMYLHRKKYFV